MIITRMVYPLSLRERFSYFIDKKTSGKFINDKNIPLHFNSQVHLDLKKTDVGHKQIIYNGFYELELSREVMQLAQTGGLMIDVGANYGYFTCLWAAQRKSNRVIAFEANPHNVSPLTHNVSQNQLTQNVVIEELAIGKEKGHMDFFLGDSEGQTGWGGLLVNKSIETSTIKVPITTLDAYCNHHSIQNISVLKIDTEGADTWVIAGAVDLLRQKRIKHIFFEHNLGRMKRLGIDPSDSVNLLKQYDYQIKEMSESEFYATPGSL